MTGVPFGIDRFAIADFAIVAGRPALSNEHSPVQHLSDATFYEAQSFSRDDQWVAITATAGPHSSGSWMCSSGIPAMIG